MAVHLLNALAREGFEELIALHDRRSGLQGFLAIHDTSAGPAFGGIRRFAYSNETRALVDCLRLARAMTTKCCLAGLPAGGAKLVVLDQPNIDWDRGYAYLGEVTERLAGRFFAGPDVGTGQPELEALCSTTRFATDPGPAGPGELAEATAAGVFAGMAAALTALDGEVDWPARCVVVQGLGAVGTELVRQLSHAGARVLASDQNEARCSAAAKAFGLEILPLGSEFSARCDIFSPNAMGGLLHDLTLSRLEARIVAGGANNLLARSRHGDRLHEAGILYVPDSLINSGALIRGALFHLCGHREPVAAIAGRIGERTSRLLSQALSEGLPPARVAQREARRLLHQRRREAQQTPTAPLGAGRVRLEPGPEAGPSGASRRNPGAQRDTPGRGSSRPADSGAVTAGDLGD
jgi:leucine dehydrogenase